ncbi:NAD-dependent epimerase/dehydratase family protein [Pseudarthrobacter sp. N5]|uniref:NAD-dependent epimerase/dehydratase family protein n=1 Tax=Pseudarthrobacter sp. N5 TaxID=3418416 RepID=UPI003CF8FC24
MSKAVILGGTGLIGRAVARRLTAAGWDVDVCGRNPAHMPADLVDGGAAFYAVDRSDGPALGRILGNGADLLVDCLAFTAADAGVLLPFLGRVGSTVMISSKAVYIDGDGRHVNSETPPRFDGPIFESQPTMAPGNCDYNTRAGYGANKVAAEQTLLDSGHPVTVVRASKVHGEGAVPAREWVFVKRILDGRRSLFLRNGGQSVDHTTAAANLAALIERAAVLPGSRILNSADPDAPTVLEISRTIASHLDHSWAEVPLARGPHPTAGATPWDTETPIVFDTTAAAALGYVPVGSYAQTVTDEVDWLVAQSRTGAHANRDDPYFAEFFNYQAEDELLSALRA